MQLKCPGCLTDLAVDDDMYNEKVLLQCPDCMHVFLANSQGRAGDTLPVQDAGEAEPEDATVLTSDEAPKVDTREFQWNVPGASITIVEGDSEGVHKKLKTDRLVVGRKGADLDLADKSTSRKHCEFIRDDEGWLLRDLGSTNGTMVNGNEIGEARLHHLDEIKIGRTLILFAETEAIEDRDLGARLDEESSEIDMTKIEAADSEPARPMPGGREMFLEHMNGSRKGRSIKLEQSRVVLGRGGESDIVIDDQGVSRKHAMIEVHSRDQVYISDLASQNGTWLNGLRIRTTRLILGDKIRMGNTVLKFVIQDLP